MVSETNYPTGAGLQASPSGLAALVKALATIYDLPTSDSDLSRVARLGASGSACRSMLGGFVEWHAGSFADGSDSLATEVASPSHWPELHALVCVVPDTQKAESSSAAMQRTAETSALLQYRIDHIVSERLKTLKIAIAEHDFDTFARITMQESNQLHAIALDTVPPVCYLTDVSRTVMTVVDEYNRVSVVNGGKLKAAYTFETGPCAVIFAMKEDMRDIVSLISSYLPPVEPFNDTFGIFADEGICEGKVINGFNRDIAKRYAVGAVKSLIHTRVGGGPRVLDTDVVLHDGNGFPRKN